MHPWLRSDAVCLDLQCCTPHWGELEPLYGLGVPWGRRGWALGSWRVCCQHSMPLGGGGTFMLTASSTVPRHFLGLPQLWLPAQACYLSCSPEFLGGSQKESAIPPAAGQSVPKLPGSSGPHGVPSGGPAACVESWHLHSWVLWSWACCQTCMSQFLVDIGVMIIPTSLCLEGHLRAWHMVNAGATSVFPEPGTPGSCLT